LFSIAPAIKLTITSDMSVIDENLFLILLCPFPSVK
jgi:hypothetical protein